MRTLEGLALIGKVEALTAALASAETKGWNAAIEAAANVTEYSYYQDCCGERHLSECCGNPIQVGESPDKIAAAIRALRKETP